MKAILLDIEGTTTPIDFVHKVLFPYAKERVGKYVEMHFGKLSDEIAQLVDESSHDQTYTVPVDPTEPGSVSAYLEHLITVDRKSTPLKSIQGGLWKEGYESGELKSVVYDDVPDAFERWTAAGKTIAIYSSGSVLAQKLLFRYTDHDDLTRFITAYFDTTVGPKRESRSYSEISAQLGLAPGEILFVSDIAAELFAARDAGMNIALSVRPGNAEQECPGDIIRAGHLVCDQRKTLRLVSANGSDDHLLQFARTANDLVDSGPVVHMAVLNGFVQMSDRVQTASIRIATCGPANPAVNHGSRLTLLYLGLHSPDSVDSRLINSSGYRYCRGRLMKFGSRSR